MITKQNLQRAAQMRSESGQGLVEYALILVLVAVVIVVVMALMGPAVGNIFSQVYGAVSTLDAGFSANVQRTGGGNGNDVVVTITTSRSLDLTLVDSQSGQTLNGSCDGTCDIVFTGVGHMAGNISITVNGYTLTKNYPAKI